MTATSCECRDCVSACRFKPGWLLPSDVEPLARFLGLTPQELFDQHLSVDYYGKGADELTFVLSPVVQGESPGAEFPFNPRGTCTFLTKDGRCAVYDARPYECSEYYHEGHDALTRRHHEVAEAWKEHQGVIRELLGREPVAPEPESDALFFDLLLGGY